MRLRDFPSTYYRWSDLLAFIAVLPIDSPVVKFLDSEHYAWNLQNILLANLVDIQHLALWFKTADAQKNIPKNKPKPIPRPGVEDDRKSNNLSKDLTPTSAEELAEKFGFKLQTKSIEITKKPKIKLPKPTN